MNADVLERFAAKYVVDGSGCWFWTAGRLSSGYGAFAIDGRMTCAHRIAYELAEGEPAPAGLQVDHLCRNKLCVNPDHLEAVTPSVNQRRVTSETHCRRGHLRCPENALKRADGAYACRLCNREAQRRHYATHPRIRRKQANT